MPSAEFFDIFGFIGFLILTMIGFQLLKKDKARALMIIIFGLLGLIVDAYFVIKTFIIN